MDPDKSFVLLDSFSSLERSVEYLDSLDFPDSDIQVRNAAQSRSISIEIMDSFSSPNTSFLASGGIIDDHYCGLNGDSCLQNIDQRSNYLQVTSTPRKELPSVELNEASWSRTAVPIAKKIKYMEGSQINIAKFYMIIYVLFTYIPKLYSYICMASSYDLKLYKILQ